ncbi:MAG: hypothetical protein HC853_05945 [Anaerolineae bacterium]|nr:hypothetical protein [Anaerolineae bacterium]
MRTSRPKSIVLKGGAQPRVYRTFEDWQAEQKLDTRTPNERGIRIGSAVMWRHKHNGLILSDRATVLAINHNTLTVTVKDVKQRTCDIDISEVVVNEEDRMSVREAEAPADKTDKADTPKTETETETSDGSEE